MNMPLKNTSRDDAIQSDISVAPLRCWKERALQTLCYEGGGLLLVAPLYAALFGTTAKESFTLLLVLAALVMLWSPLHNTAFDLVDARVNARVASARPQGLRLVHALSLESTCVLFTLPVVMWLGGHGFWAALAVDVGLTLAYTAYAYVFHLTFDWLRPVTTGA